jgi:hypothetical protein
MGLSLTDFNVPDMKCPACGTVQDGALATHPGSAAPVDGDVCICFDCSNVCIYTLVNGTLALRDANEAELNEILRDPHVQKCIAAVRIARET